MTDSLVKPSKRALNAQRKAFQKARDGELSALRKGTAWRKTSAWLFRQQGDTFIDAFIVGHPQEARTTVRVAAKPMELDSIFWRLTGLPENEHAPLSLRANGAFTCSGPLFLDEMMSDENDTPEASAARLLSLADTGAGLALQKMKEKRFSKLMEESAEAGGQAVGAQFGPSYVTALILDKRLEEAERVIREHQEGIVESRVNFTFGAFDPEGRSDFYDLALKYIRANR